MSGHLHKLDHGQRKFIPGLLIVLFGLLNIGMLPVLHSLPFSFGLAEIAIFYWSLLRPSRVHYGMLFILGLVTDAVLGGMFGVHALSFMLVRLLSARIRHFIPHNHSFFPLLGFALVYGVSCALSFLFARYFGNSYITPAPVIAGWLATVGIYPLVVLLFKRIFRALTGKR
ncbi:MAG: rod shape-determining protein MreD [Rickettsiales bacterium]